MSSKRTRKTRRELLQVAITGTSAWFAQRQDPKYTIYGAIIGGGIGAIISEYLIPPERDDQAEKYSIEAGQQ